MAKPIKKLSVMLDESANFNLQISYNSKNRNNMKLKPLICPLQIVIILLTSCANSDSKKESIENVQTKDSIINKDTTSLVKHYDKNFKAHDDVNSINMFKEKLGVKEIGQDNYELNGEWITELYDKRTGEFIGFQGDTTKFDFHKLKYLKRSKRLSYLIGKYSQPYADRIFQHKVWVGMSKDEAIESWGKPKDINTTITENMEREQWVYGEGQYLYLENGIVTTIQN